MASSSSTVLGTYGLLEQVLIQLPLKDLFIVQRVATSWKDLIERSEAIRKKMFLMAEGPVLHPDAASTRLQYSDTMRLHPALQAACLLHTPGKRRHRIEVGTARLWKSYLAEMEFSVNIELDLTAVSQIEEKMLLTQPPIAAISHKLFCYYDSQRPFTILRPQTGITFGDMIEVASTDMKEHVESCEMCRSDESEAHHQWKFSVSLGPAATVKKAEPCHVCSFKEASQGD